MKSTKEQSVKFFLTWLGDGLAYPQTALLEEWQEIKEELNLLSPEAAENMENFFKAAKIMSLAARQEVYVQTFDLNAQGSLYLSIYLFGEESFKRAELMAGLKAVYENKSRFEMTELPDHLAVVLKHCTFFGDAEWEEMVHFCLLPALPKIIAELEKKNSAYGFILKAVELLLQTPKAAASGEVTGAEPIHA